MNTEQGAQLVDYLEVAKRRRWSIVLPLLLSMLVGGLLVKYLPRQYVSSATIGVTSASVSGNLARSTPMDVSERLRAVSHELLSDTVIEQMAREEGLLEHTPLEAIIADVRAHTRVSLPEKSLAASGKFEPDTFVVSYAGATPELAQRVANRLTQVFVASHSQLRETRAEDTSAFLASQLSASQARLNAAEARLRQLRDTYRGRLPEQTLANQQSVASLRQQAEANAQALRGERDRLSIVEQQLAAMQAEAAANVPNEALAQAQQRVADLEKQLADARMTFTPKHPEVQRLEGELKTARAEEAAARERRPDTSAPVRVDPAQRQLLAERDGIRVRIRELQANDARLAEQIAQFQSRLDEAPLVEQQITALQREYDFANHQHQQLAEQYQAALLAEDLERKRAGEQFTVLYPASLPTSPSSPNVPLVLAMSVLAGIALGGGLALAREYMDRAVYDTRTLQNEFGRVVLAEIPRF